MGNSCQWLRGTTNRRSENDSVSPQASHTNTAYIHDDQQPTKQPTTTAVQDYKIVKVLFSYQARDQDDLTIKDGEILHIVQSEQDWWQARRPTTGEIGWIPSNFVAPEKSLESEIWYFGKIPRTEADGLLLQPGNKRGTFLVRLSMQTKGAYALSILNHDVDFMATDETRSGILHYQIRTLDAGGFYISPKNTFGCLPDLIKFYKESVHGLCCCLCVSCPRPQPVMYDISRATRDKWEIPRGSIKLGDQLGEGNYGTVYKAKWNDTVDVAVKSLKEQKMTRDKFLKEAELMKKLDHRNLLQLYAVVAEGSPVLIVTEFMPNGCLLHYLRENRNRFILTQLINITVQVASGMMYLESEKFIHRDLAARNVLVGDNMVIKVADFGMARFVPEDFYFAHDREFPYKWTAPEAIEFQEFSIKSDVWSFGVLMYEVLTCGKQLYIGIKNPDILGYLKRGNKLPHPELSNGIKVPRELYDTMRNCWKLEAISRPTFESLFNYLEDVLINLDPNYKEMDTSDDSKNTASTIQRKSLSGSESSDNSSVSVIDNNPPKDMEDINVSLSSNSSSSDSSRNQEPETVTERELSCGGEVISDTPDSIPPKDMDNIIDVRLSSNSSDSSRNQEPETVRERELSCSGEVISETPDKGSPTVINGPNELSPSCNTSDTCSSDNPEPETERKEPNTRTEVNNRTPGKGYLRALYTYSSTEEDDLSFHEGDILETADDSGGDWIWARHTVSQNVGYVPSNYVELEIQ